MYITDILNNLPKKENNELSNKIAKASEIRKIKSRVDSFITQILDYLSEENSYIQKGLTYGSAPSAISDDEKKELTNALVSEIKTLPEKLKTEIGSFFDSIKDSDDKPCEVKKEIEISVSPTNSDNSEVKAKPVFGY